MARSGSRPALIVNGRDLHGSTGPASEFHSADVEVIFRDIDELAIEIGPGGVRIWETEEGRDLRDFGLVQVAAYQRPTAVLVGAVADYLTTVGVHAVNITGIGAPTKVFKYVRLANRGLTIPATLYLPPRLMVDSYDELAERLDLPFVLKTASGAGGRLTTLVSTESAFTQRLQDATHARAGFLAQELVASDGSYYLFVLGGQVSLAIWSGSGDDVLAQSSWERGTLVHPQELEHAAKETAIQAAAALEYDIAGVRLVKHWTTGKWCVLNVNPSPSISGGEYAAAKMGAYIDYLNRRLARPVPGNRDETQHRPTTSEPSGSVQTGSQARPKAHSGRFSWLSWGFMGEPGEPGKSGEPR